MKLTKIINDNFKIEQHIIDSSEITKLKSKGYTET